MTIGAGPFDVRGQPAAVELAALLRLGLARGEAVPVGGLERLGEEQVEVAGIVLLAHRRGVGHLRGLSRSCAGAARPDRCRSGATRYPSAARGRAGIPAGRRRDRRRWWPVLVITQVILRSTNGHVVGAGRHLRPDEQRDDDAGAPTDRRRHWRRPPCAGQDPAVLVERQRRLVELVAAGGRGGELLAALGAPLHGPLQHLGRPHRHRLVGLDAGPSCRSRRRCRAPARAPCPSASSG